MQPCLRRVVRGDGDLQHRRIFDFPSERESNAHVVLIDGHAARIYRIRIPMLTSVSPEAASGQIRKPIVEVFLQASVRLLAGSETWYEVAGWGLVCELTAFCTAVELLAGGAHL